MDYIPVRTGKHAHADETPVEGTDSYEKPREFREAALTMTMT